MKTVPLSHWVDELESGARPKGGIKDGVGEVPSLGAEHLADDGRFDFSKDKRIPYEFFRSMKKGWIQSEDILVVKDGATTGKVSFVTGDFPYKEAAINEHVFRLGVIRKKADPRFVFRYLQSPLGQQQILSDFRGATVGGIGRTFLDKVLLPDVALSEQRRIAAILDKADAIRRKREQALALADDFLRSVFLEMFGDPLSNPKGWPVKTLGAHLEEIRYGTSEKCGDETPEQDIPVLRIPNVVNGVIDWTDLKFTSLNAKERERMLLHDGDILFVRTNGNPNYIGRCAVYEGNRPAAFASYLIRARLRDDAPVSPRFVSNCLSMPSYRSRMIQEAKTTAGNYNANTTGLRSLPIIEPPKEMQAVYARVGASLNKTAVKIASDLTEANDLFASLSQRAFRGEL